MSSHAPAHTSVHAPAPKPNTGFEHTALHLKAASAAHTATSGSGGSIVRTVVGLAIVIAVIYGLTWVVRKLKSKDMPAAGDSLERVASLPLGTNKSVALVRVGSELHLLGVADNAVTGIRSFSEDEAIDLGLPVTPPGAAAVSRDDGEDGVFGSALKAVASRDQLSQTLDALKRMTQR